MSRPLRSRPAQGMVAGGIPTGEEEVGQALGAVPLQSSNGAIATEPPQDREASQLLGHTPGNLSQPLQGPFNRTDRSFTAREVRAPAENGTGSAALVE